MANLLVEKLYDVEHSSAPILREPNDRMSATQRRAFELFNRRGPGPGADLDDRLRAEREVLWPPQSELIEDEKEVRIQIAVPGLEPPPQVHVTLLWESIIVKGESIHKHDGGNGSVHFCEFSEKTPVSKISVGPRDRR